MRQYIVGFALAVVVATTGVVSFTTQPNSGPVKTIKTPALSEISYSTTASSVAPDLLSQVTDYLAWIEGVKRWEAEEAARLEEAARQARQASPSASTQNTFPDCDSIPEWFPRAIAWRESHCTRGINTGNGYFGYAQVASFHWFGGACDGLSWEIPAEEDECVDRLSLHGTRLSPWGA